MTKNSVKAENIPVIAVYRGFYVVDGRPAGIKTSMNRADARVFANRAEVEETIDEYFRHDIRLLKAETKRAVQYGILEMKKRNGLAWVSKFKDRKLFFDLEAKYAKKFASAKSAQNWINRNGWKFSECEFRVSEIK